MLTLADPLECEIARWRAYRRLWWQKHRLISGAGAEHEHCHCERRQNTPQTRAVLGLAQKPVHPALFNLD
jgi:hypothetical protein